MKFRLTFKTPDLDTVMESLADDLVEARIEDAGEDMEEGIKLVDEQDELREELTESMQRAADPWLEYGENITVEFDTETGAATVVPARRAMAAKTSPTADIPASMPT